MNIQTEKVADHHMKVTVTFEEDIFEQYKQRAAKRIARDKKIPGFRPGKAPYEFIRRYFGDEAIETQAIDILIEDEYPKVLEQADIQPAAAGIVEDIPKTDPLTLVFKVPLAPDVKLGDYRSIRMDYSPPKVTEKDVDKVLRDMQYSYATTETSDQPAQLGDVVIAKVTAIIQDPSTDQSPEYMKDSRTQLLLDSSEGKDEQPFPGFSKAMIGVKPGDETILKHKYTKTSNQEELRGKTVEYTISVEAVRKLSLPELNDSFAQTLGEYETLEKLRAEVQHQLEHEKTDQYNDGFFEDVFQAIINQASIEYSPQTLEEEADSVLNGLKRNLEREGLDLQTYLKTRQLEMTDFLENEVQPVARKRLEQSLVLEEIARLEKITLEDGTIQNTYQETLQVLESTPNLKKRGSQELRRIASRMALGSANRMLNNKVMDRIKTIVTGQNGDEQAAGTKPSKKVSRKSNDAASSS